MLVIFLWRWLKSPVERREFLNAGKKKNPANTNVWCFFWPRLLEQLLQLWLVPACWSGPFHTSTVQCPNTSLGCSMQVCKTVSDGKLLFCVSAVLFLSFSYFSWTLEGSPTKAQRVTAPPLDLFVLNMVFTCVVALFIDQVWWVLSSLPSLSWEDLWWWGLPGTQQASWEVCPPWPCVPRVRSSLTWAGPWLSALEWSSRPPSVSIMQFHLINPVSAALQTVPASRFSYKWDKWARIWLRKGRFQQ